MSSSGCPWARSRWPTSPASTSAGTATRTASRTSATPCVQSTPGGRRRAKAPGTADEARIQLLEAAARQSGGRRKLYALGAALFLQQAQHRQRHGRDAGAGGEGRGAAFAVPQQPGAEAREQTGDPADEPECAEARRTQPFRRAVGDHPRENALRQRHMRAPQADADKEKRVI